MVQKNTPAIRAINYGTLRRWKKTCVPSACPPLRLCAVPDFVPAAPGVYFPNRSSSSMEIETRKNVSTLIGEEPTTLISAITPAAPESIPQQPQLLLCSYPVLFEFNYLATQEHHTRTWTAGERRFAWAMYWDDKLYSIYA